MAWQDLTPQLRTRLNRLERVVGWFVFLALALFLLGISYYVYQAGQRKGWFLVKAPYFTFLDNAAGMKIGDTINLMGFEVGEITEITAMPPFAPWNVYVGFVVREPYYGYLWSDSRARVGAGDLLGGRTIEVTKGTNGIPTYLFSALRDFALDEALALPEGHGWRFNLDVADPDGSNHLVQVFAPVTEAALLRLADLGTNTVQLFDANEPTPRITALYDDKQGRYVTFDKESKGYFLLPEESPALTERMEKVMNLVEVSLPNILGLTNPIQRVLNRAADLTQNADDLLADVRPAMTNLTVITEGLRDPEGSLGRWLIPTNLQQQAQGTLLSADLALQTARTNLVLVSAQLQHSLENLALLTSNLNAQVQGNQFILADLSDLIRNTDAMVQGLKRHWLLKSAFGVDTNTPPANPLQPTLSPP